MSKAVFSAARAIVVSLLVAGCATETVTPVTPAHYEPAPPVAQNGVVATTGAAPTAAPASTAPVPPAGTLVSPAPSAPAQQAPAPPAQQQAPAQAPAPVPGEIYVYMNERDVHRAFDVIGQIDVSDPGKYQNLTLDSVMPRLKDQARSIGANGIIIDRQEKIVSGIISRGISVQARAIRIN
jgi:hypothetical protein